MWHRRAVIGLVAVSLAACATSQTKLEFPASGDSIGCRRSYDALKSSRFTYSIWGRNPRELPRISGVILGDGREVHSAKALLSVVSSESGTANHARKSVAWRERQLWPGLFLGAGTATAAGLLAGGALLNSEKKRFNALFVGGLVTAAISLFGAGGALIIFDDFANTHAARAFRRYNGDLLEHVDELCSR